MAIRFAIRALLVVGAILFLTTPVAVYSCGPFLPSAVFAFSDWPDASPKAYVAGNLGIVRPSFRESYLVVAYRYLSGLELSKDNQQAPLAFWGRGTDADSTSADNEVENWKQARAKILNLPSEAPSLEVYAPVSKDDPYSRFLNCPAAAFHNAVATLEERSSKFGVSSPNFQQWIAAQDQVFANCDGHARIIPAMLETGDPLSRADRAYQIAAAHFYARDFEDAAAQFDSIAKASTSPWAEISRYLAARALVREAMLAQKPDAPFDSSVLKLAEARLEAIVADAHATSPHDAAARLLDFVRFRTDPVKRTAELDHVILQPELGSNFKQNFWDYALLLSAGQKAEDPSDWLQTFRQLKDVGPGADSNTATHAVARWKETGSQPWLIASLAATRADSGGISSEREALLAAASKIPARSPAYLTVQYYAIGLMIATRQQEAARKRLDALLARSQPEMPVTSHNLFNEQRLKLTLSIDDFLRHAAEAPVYTDVDDSTMAAVPSEDAKPEPPLFAHYAATVFLKRLPLTTLLYAAGSQVLEQPLRRELARAAWVRAVLLQDWKAADALQPLLRELDLPLWNSMAAFRAAAASTSLSSGDDERQFTAAFVLLNNPGMKPAVREGMLRAQTLGAIDSFRDNWWCADLWPGSTWFHCCLTEPVVEQEAEFPFPAGLTETQKTAALAEWKKLSAVGPAPNYLAQQILGYAQRHPHDQRVAEALYLAVRATHYGCGNDETSKLSKAAFEYVHQHYPESEWAGKTKYYY